MSAIQSSYASVEKAKNDIIQQYKDSPGTAKYVERIMKPLLNALMATKKTLDEAETSNKTVEGAVKNLSQINTTYNDMMTGLNNAQTADSSNTGGKAENIPVNEVKPIKLTPRGRISKKEQAAIDEISKRPENKGLTPRQLREIYRKEQANVEGDATTAPTGDSQTSPSSPNNAVNQPVNVPSKEAQAFYEEFFKLNPTATEDQALSAFLAKRTNQPGKP
jgi:hypothetical protein